MEKLLYIYLKPIQSKLGDNATIVHKTKKNNQGLTLPFFLNRKKRFQWWVHKLYRNEWMKYLLRKNWNVMQGRSHGGGFSYQVHHLNLKETNHHSAHLLTKKTGATWFSKFRKSCISDYIITKHFFLQHSTSFFLSLLCYSREEVLNLFIPE